MDDYSKMKIVSKNAYILIRDSADKSIAQIDVQTLKVIQQLSKVHPEPISRTIIKGENILVRSVFILCIHIS